MAFIFARGYTRKIYGKKNDVIKLHGISVKCPFGIVRVAIRFLRNIFYSAGFITFNR